MNLRDFTVLTCEHASARIPDELRPAFESQLWEQHQIYDLGAAQLSQRLADKFEVALISGTFSRLVMDLNRSRHHRQLSQLITGRQTELWQSWLCNYYDPFRQQVQNLIAERPQCIHLSIHSFTRQLGGRTRNADIGILYDPKRSFEAAFARELIHCLKNQQYRVRANYPYRGTADGHTTQLRKLFPEQQYIGIEIEVCNDILASNAGLDAIGTMLGACLPELLKKQMTNRV